jgi:hypothetical protein
MIIAHVRRTLTDCCMANGMSEHQPDTTCFQVLYPAFLWVDGWWLAFDSGMLTTIESLFCTHLDFYAKPSIHKGTFAVPV